MGALPGITVGDNVPYTGKLKGDTLYRHGTKRGLAHALVELRQDLILDEKGQAEWADRLAHVLRGMLASPKLARRLSAIEHYGSHCDCSLPQTSQATNQGERPLAERTQMELAPARPKRASKG